MTVFVTVKLELTVEDTLKLQKDIDLLMGHEISICQMQHYAADK